jgi:hypothetical protein
MIVESDIVPNATGRRSRSFQRVNSRPVLVAGSAVLLVLLGACGNDKPTVEHAVVPAATTSTTPAAVTTTTTAEGAHAYVDAGDYVTGLHIAYITSVSGDEKKILIDVAQFLIGDAAIKAYKQDTGEQLDGDYYARNQNKQLRSFPLSSNAQFRVNTLGGYEPTDPNKGHVLTFGEFVALYNSKPDESKQTLFWVSLEDGKATRVEEQYVP